MVRKTPDSVPGEAAAAALADIEKLSSSSQDYLKAVWNLREWSPEPVTAKALSKVVGVRLSTASDAVRKLRELGYLDHAPYGEVTLTDRGRAVALTMVRRHRLIETFLVHTLCYRWDQVHEEAERLEHAVSDFLIDQIAEHLGHPSHDPHGDPIPDTTGTISLPQALSLSALPPETSARVVRISDDDPELLQFFAEKHLDVGATVEVEAGAPFSDSAVVKIVDSPAASSGDAGQPTSFPLGTAALETVWVSPS